MKVKLLLVLRCKVSVALGADMGLKSVKCDVRSQTTSHHCLSTVTFSRLGTGVKWIKWLSP